MGIHRLFLQAASSARMLKTQCHHSMTVLFFNGMPPHDRVRTPGSKWQDMKQYPISEYRSRQIAYYTGRASVGP